MDELSQAGNQFGRGLSVLIVDPDPRFRADARDLLERFSFAVQETPDWDDALTVVATAPPDIVIMAEARTYGDSLRHIRAMRRTTTAVVLATTGGFGTFLMAEVVDAGADDLLVKAMPPLDLLRRLSFHTALLRMRARASDEPSAHRAVTEGGVSLDFGRCVLTRDGKPLRLSHWQWHLVATLAQAQGSMLSLGRLWSALWSGYFEPPPLTQHAAEFLVAHLEQLRARIEPDAQHPVLLSGDRTAGYRLASAGSGQPDVLSHEPWANAHPLGERAWIKRLPLTSLCRLDATGTVLEWYGPTPCRAIGASFAFLYSPEARAAGEPVTDLARAAEHGLWRIQGIRDLREPHDSDASEDYLVYEGLAEPPSTSPGFLLAQRRPSSPTRTAFARSRNDATLPRSLTRHIIDILGRYWVPSFLPKVVGTLPRFDLWARMSTRELEQVVENLMRNAVDAVTGGHRTTTSEPQVHITLSRLVLDDEAAAARGVSSGPYIEIMVRDNGPGGAPKVRDTVFDAFMRTEADWRTTRIRDIARQAGGYVTVRSAPGHGATFRVGVPEASAAVPIDDPSELGSPLPSDEPDLLGEYVMVIEDDAARRHIVARTLADAGYRVAVATSDEGDELLRGHAPYSALLVFGLEAQRPGALALWHGVRDRCPHLSLIACTDTSAAVRATWKGLPSETPILTPPFTATGLIAAVCDALQEPRAAFPQVI